MNNLRISANRNVSFTRAIRPDEEKDYGQTISDAKKFVGVKNMALVMHGSSFPQADKDLFIGSPFNTKAAEVNDFLKMHGFDSIQLGPPGLISKDNTSPYCSSINSKNYLFSDMSKLSTPQYGCILKYSDIMDETSDDYQYSRMTEFDQAFDSYDRLFKKAYENMETSDNKQAVKLRKEYENYKETAGDWLETDALYDVLQAKNKTTDFNKWPEVEKNLIEYKNNPQSPMHEEALDVVSQIEEENLEALELYKFKQFIVNKQEKEFIKENPGKLNYISDAIIGFSMKDFWANQDAFMGDFRVGCPGGGEGFAGQVAHQVWDIPVINPKTLFKEDGSLGKGGELFKQKFGNLLDTYQNIRVDHVLGLIDPWIYDKKNVEVVKDAKGKTVSTNAHGAFLSDMNWDGSIDPNRDYSKILEKIVLPMLKEKNLSVNDVVWESLGSETNTFKEVYHNKLHLPKIVDLKWDKGEHQSKDNWLVISTHDDPPFAKIAKKRADSKGDYYENNRGWAMDSAYLIGFMHPEKLDSERSPIMGDLSWDTRLRVITKNQELLRCGEKVQVSFMDFFGLSKTYNEKGHSNKDNWKLRLSKDYKNQYYKTLEDKDWHKIALNMPELLKRAVISKIYTANKTRVEQDKDFQEAKPLIDKLDKYEKILYEKEEASKTAGYLA